MREETKRRLDRAIAAERWAWIWPVLLGLAILIPALAPIYLGWITKEAAKICCLAGFTLFLALGALLGVAERKIQAKIARLASTKEDPREPTRRTFRDVIAFLFVLPN